MAWDWETDTGDWVNPLDMLDETLRSLAKDHLPGIDRDTLGARCVALQECRQQLDAIIAVGIAEAERAGVPAQAGQRTMAQYLASRTHASPDALRADARVGVWVGGYPTLEHAMLDGKLSRQHADPSANSRTSESPTPCYVISICLLNGLKNSNGNRSNQRVPTG